MTRLGLRARTFWAAIRALSGDDAYERYVAHHGARHPDRELLSRRAFYLQEVQRRWSGVTRCC